MRGQTRQVCARVTGEDPLVTNEIGLAGFVKAMVEEDREAHARLVEAQLETVRTRINAIDKATEVFQQGLERVPTDVDKATVNLRNLHEEKFRTITLQFRERDE